MLIGHMPELVILLVVALLFVGPGKLPSVGGAIGRSIREFKREAGEITGSVQRQGIEERDQSSRG